MPTPGLLQRIWERICRWFGREPQRPPEPREPAGGTLPQPLSRRVSLLIFDPALPTQGNRRLHELLGWNDPDQLVQQYIQDVEEVSYGYAHYQVSERVLVDGFPLKQDGFAYSGEDYLNARSGASSFHQPDAVSYEAILAEHGLVEKINRGEIDEIWLMGFPYAGFYESRMGGPGAFWCNAPPLENTGANRRFVLMGFNYERGVGEMLENLGHRTESVLEHVFRKVPPEDNPWKRFTRHEQSAPGQAEVGSVHYAPNSRRDYDWGNKSVVMSRADAWLSYPSLAGGPRPMSSGEWGSGDIREHHRWWFRHLPHFAGEIGGFSNNWWEYIIDPNTVR